MSQSLQALRRANPRTKAGFAESVDTTTRRVRAQIESSEVAPQPRTRGSSPMRRLLGFSAVGVAVAAATVVAVFLTPAGSPGVVPGVDNAAAAIEKAARVTTASAQQSGTAIVAIRHNGDMWGGVTIRWNGEDLALSRGTPQRRTGYGLRVVDGMMYGLDERGEWVALGSPASVDPDSGETPAEYLAAVREDVGGATLGRIIRGMTGPTARQGDDGSTVYAGTVTAGLIARETGIKEGQAIRVLPFGFVAHDEAANPTSPLETALTVAPDGVVREIAITWGAWRYVVTYSHLGSTPAPAAPANARIDPRVLPRRGNP